MQPITLLEDRIIGPRVRKYKMRHIDNVVDFILVHRSCHGQILCVELISDFAPFCR